MRIKRDNQRLTLGILGKVKTGDTFTKNERKLPKSLDHFRFTSDHAHRVDKAIEIFGNQPQSLPITFHSDNDNDVCSQRFELRNNSGQLVAYGDGEQYFLSTKDGFQLQDRSAMKGLTTKYSTEKYKAEWNEVLILRFIILTYPELGLWEYRTKGKDTSIPQIIGMFDTVKGFAGTVIKVPFRLNVSKHKSNRANANRQYPIVSLTCDLSMEMQELVGLHGDQIQGLITPDKIAQIETPKLIENAAS